MLASGNVFFICFSRKCTLSENRLYERTIMFFSISFNVNNLQLLVGIFSFWWQSEDIMTYAAAELLTKAYCKNYTSLAELVCVNSFICYVSIGFNNFAFQIFKYHTNRLLRLYFNKKHRYTPIHACNNRDILCTLQTLAFLTLPCAISHFMKNFISDNHR